MNPTPPQPPHHESDEGRPSDPEARLTALLLGELSADEAAAVREEMAKNPALADLYRQLEKTIDLVREAVASPEETIVHADAPLKLAGERREKLLESFKVIPQERLTKTRRWKERWTVSWREYASVAALFVALCLLAGVVLWRALPEGSAAVLDVALLSKEHAGRSRESSRFRWFRQSSSERASSQPLPAFNEPVDAEVTKGSQPEYLSVIIAPPSVPPPPPGAVPAPASDYVAVEPSTGLPALVPPSPSRNAALFGEKMYDHGAVAAGDRPVTAGGARAAGSSSIVLPAQTDALDGSLVVNGPLTGGDVGGLGGFGTAGTAAAKPGYNLNRGLDRSNFGASATPKPAGEAEQQINLSQLVDKSQELSGRTGSKPASPPEPKISINKKRELTPAELAQAVDFYAGGIAMVPQGEKFLKEVPATQAGKQTEFKKSESDEVTAEGMAAKTKSPPLAQEPASGLADLSKGINVAGGERDTKPSAAGTLILDDDGSRNASLRGEEARRRALLGAEHPWAAPQPQESASRPMVVTDLDLSGALSKELNGRAGEKREAKPATPGQYGATGGGGLGGMKDSGLGMEEKRDSSGAQGVQNLGWAAVPGETESRSGWWVESVDKLAATTAPAAKPNEPAAVATAALPPVALQFDYDALRDGDGRAVSDLNRALATGDPTWTGVLNAPQVAPQNELLGRAAAQDWKSGDEYYVDLNRNTNFESFGNVADKDQSTDVGGPMGSIAAGKEAEKQFVTRFAVTNITVPNALAFAQDREAAEVSQRSKARGLIELPASQSSSSVEGREKLLEENKRLTDALKVAQDDVHALASSGIKVTDIPPLGATSSPTLEPESIEHLAREAKELKANLVSRSNSVVKAQQSFDSTPSQSSEAELAGAKISYEAGLATIRRLDQAIKDTAARDETQLARLSEIKKRELEEEEPAAKRPAPPPAAPIPQPEIQTAANAFSTFSLNVSDVSFKLAAAALEKGTMPDPSTVRSEEFINAFDYRDPEPAPGVPVAFAWERARYPFAHNRDLLRFSIKTAASGRQPGRPLNLVLLLDNSGSMERADRVTIIRECLRVLASQLRPEDRVSVVAFARTPRLWIDGLSGQQASELVTRVGGLTPQGGTNLEDAMNLAYQTALRHYSANGVNRVVLLTDGAANLGDVKPESLKRKVEAHRKQGVALDCFGIGWEGYNDDLLETLSRNGDGRYGFVNTPEAASSEFAGQLAGALRVAASDVKVQVQFNPQRVTLHRQIGYAKHQLKKEQFRDNTVDAAEIGAAEAGNALYVAQVNPQGEGPIATVRVRFKVPGTSTYREHEWIVPFNGAAKPLEQSTTALRLAGTASAFSEWLVSSPFAGEVTPDRLLGLLGGVADTYGADARSKKLEWMIRQAKAAAGK